MASVHEVCVPSKCLNHCCNKDECGSSLDCSISIVIIILVFTTIALFLLIMCIGRSSLIKRMVLPNRAVSIAPIDKMRKEILTTDEVKTDIEKFQMTTANKNDDSMMCALNPNDVKRKGSREDDRLENRRTQSHSSSSKRTIGAAGSAHPQLPEISTVIIPDIMNIHMPNTNKSQDDVNDFGH